MRTIPSAPLGGAVSGAQSTVRLYDTLLHPARAFGHPAAVLDDPDLSIAEKRAILTCWASEGDSVANDDPARAPIEDVLEALRVLDREPDGIGGRAKLRPRWRRSLLRGTDRAA